MKEKVTVIGFMGAGKTCYMAGMYDNMSNGMKNFSLVEPDVDMDFYLQTLWEAISDGKNREWPVPNDDTKEFTFALCHICKKVMEFGWYDYPGGALLDPGYGLMDEINGQLAESSCLLLMINGESFGAEAADREDYIRKVSRNLKKNGDLKAIAKLSQLGLNQELPPMAIVITKSDLINDSWVPADLDDEQAAALINETLSSIITTNFQSVFGTGGTGQRLVMITAVTLGEGISEGADAEPVNIEQPIAYAVLTMLCGYVAKAKAAKQQNLKNQNAKNTWLGRIIHADEIAKLKAEAEEMDREIAKFSADAHRLLDLFEEDKCLYVNGEKTPLRDFFVNSLQ